MVLQTYGISINGDDECIENRLIDHNDDVIISDRKSVIYSDNMLAMSPFAGDYPPTTNYINYTDLDANYVTQGDGMNEAYK
ncbi:CLUMA_CG008169, isoform A [Clunio marinus]|uniref:CLUMA_CG008169, isoform A n=1 Tax=Clunio marinus TaxID=568069 RepID=A0A1J1I307_9DIPT|nr:CLUMA_CG008169, isoform A [Clunio marinus]